MRILPSSLTRVLSCALGYSPHLRVSVSGTVAHAWPSRSFPAPWLIRLRLAYARLPVTARLGRSFDPALDSSPLGPELPFSGADPPCASRHQNMRGAGILTSFPSATRFRLALGTGLPRADCLYPGNLRFPADGNPTRLFVTYACILSSVSSSAPRGFAFTGPRNAPLPTAAMRRFRGFGAMLSPASLSARGCSTSELLRTLSRDGCF